MNVAAIPKELVESTLFGHERGAFTGTHKQQMGKFELAAGGTLFLDEIGDLELELQVNLLRAIQRDPRRGDRARRGNQADQDRLPPGRCHECLLRESRS